MSEPIYVEVNDPSKDEIVARHFEGETNWFLLIKDLRAAYGISIYDAEKMALAHPGWRRWCNVRLRTSAQCRVKAWGHIRAKGDASLFIREGAKYRVR